MSRRQGIRGRGVSAAIGTRSVAALSILAGVGIMVSSTSTGLVAASRSAIQSARIDAQNPPTIVPTYVPAGSRAEADVVEATRLIGIPVVRTSQFPAVSPVAFFCTAAMADRQFPGRLRAYVGAGSRALVTSRLADRLGRLPSQFAGRIFILPSGHGRVTVLSLPQAQVDRLRNFALYPLGLRVQAPPRVALTLEGREALVLENQNPYAAGVRITFLTGKWPAVAGLSNRDARLPLVGSSVSLQAPPKSAQRFQIVSRG